MLIRSTTAITATCQAVQSLTKLTTFAATLEMKTASTTGAVRSADRLSVTGFLDSSPTKLSQPTQLQLLQEAGMRRRPFARLPLLEPTPRRFLASQVSGPMAENKRITVVLP